MDRWKLAETFVKKNIEILPNQYFSYEDFIMQIVNC